MSSDSDLIQKVLCTALCPALTWVAPRLQLPRDNTIFLLFSSLLLPCLGQTKFSSALNGQHTSALDTIALTSADEEKNNAGFSPPRSLRSSRSFSPPRSFLLGDTCNDNAPLHACEDILKMKGNSASIVVSVFESLCVGLGSLFLVMPLSLPLFVQLGPTRLSSLFQHPENKDI